MRRARASSRSLPPRTPRRAQLTFEPLSFAPVDRLLASAPRHRPEPSRCSRAAMVQLDHRVRVLVRFPRRECLPRRGTSGRGTLATQTRAWTLQGHRRGGRGAHCRPFRGGSVSSALGVRRRVGVSSAAMDAPGPRREEIEEALPLVADAVRAYLERLDDLPARTRNAAEVSATFREPLPERGVGAVAALRRLIDGVDGTAATGGPRCYHFVIGGSTPAAFGADWLATAWDQIAYAWVTSPLACTLEIVSLAWLRELFGLPAAWGGVMVTGATMANFVGLAAARQWWGERHGFDAAERGLAGGPPVPVFASGHIHAQRRQVSRHARHRPRQPASFDQRRDRQLRPRGAGGGARCPRRRAVDRRRHGGGAQRRRQRPGGGDRRPRRALRRLAARRRRLRPLRRAVAAHARTSCAASSARSRCASTATSGSTSRTTAASPSSPTRRCWPRPSATAAEYLPDPEDPRPNFGTIGPESSRRARSFAVWATLAAYGREGHRAMVERHLDLGAAPGAAGRRGARPRAAGGGAAVRRLLPLQPGRRRRGGARRPQPRGSARRCSPTGATTPAPPPTRGKVALRPALVNWRTREEDVDGFVAVVRELGREAAAAVAVATAEPLLRA